MQRREKYLVVFLVSAVIIWRGYPVIHGLLIAPITGRNDQLLRLDQSIDERKVERALVQQSERKFKAWNRQSLPADSLDAQRLYQAWLTDLAQLTGFTNLKVSPSRRVAKGDVYSRVQITLKGEATFKQLCDFLYFFNRTDLLHRVTQMDITSEEHEGNPRMDVSLTAEGLSLPDDQQRSRQKRSQLFPQARLDKVVSAESTEVTVTGADEFPLQAGFRIRIGTEYLDVLNRDPDGTWKVRRGADSTAVGSHGRDQIVELVPVNPNAKDKTRDDYQDLIAHSPFAKPFDYQPKLTPIGDKIVVRGEPFKFVAKVTGFDPSQGAPVFSLDDVAVSEMRIDSKSGEFSWEPAEKQPVGDFEVTIQVAQAGLPAGSLKETIRLTLREPNHAPALAPIGDQTVALGETVTFTAFALDSDEPENKLSFTLGEGAPAGASIDSKSGEFRWSPEAAVQPADYDVTVVVTDDGTPPRSHSQTLTVTVLDDAAQFTYLVASVSDDDDRQAWLYDRSSNQRMVVRKGTTFTFGGTKAFVVAIGRDFTLLQIGEATWRLELGENLSSMRKLETNSDKTTNAGPTKSSPNDRKPSVQVESPEKPPK